MMQAQVKRTATRQTKRKVSKSNCKTFTFDVKQVCAHAESVRQNCSAKTQNIIMLPDAKQVADNLKQTFAFSCKIKPSGKPITLLHSSGCKRRTRSPTRYMPVFAPIPPPNADKVTACPLILYTRSPCPPLPTVPIRNGRFSRRSGIVSLKRKSSR